MSYITNDINNVQKNNLISKTTKQFSTFLIGDRLYGLDVTAVQEVTKSLPITKVPLAPKFVYGLINLRGQVATAIGLKELFELNDIGNNKELMNIVCRGDGLLLSFLVDQIGDVLEVEDNLFEPTPVTLPQSLTKFMFGVYKIQGNLLSVLDVKKITQTIQDL
jgi:purine-binding chemotaxis protein CheW